MRNRAIGKCRRSKIFRRRGNQEDVFGEADALAAVVVWISKRAEPVGFLPDDGRISGETSVQTGLDLMRPELKGVDVDLKMSYLEALLGKCADTSLT